MKKKNNKSHHSALKSYAPAPETTPVKIQKQYGVYINGKLETPKSAKLFTTINPATGKKLSSLVQSSTGVVNKAVQAAKKAEVGWRKLSGAQRGEYLFKIARLIQEKSRELAVLETLDGGKPIKESRDIDLPACAHHFFYYAGWADKIDYLIPGQKFQPIGVCGQIIPWNFPLLMLSWKIAPALAAGNTVVLKPAEQTSLTALMMTEIFSQAGLPPGVVNIITGDGVVGKNLVEHADVKKIAFTGSTTVGKLIRQSAKGKKLTLELGGKSANIIFADSALDQAIEGVVAGIYFNQGHVCCAGSRVLVEESVKDIFLKKLKRRVEQIRVGDPLDKNTDMGAINSSQQWEQIQKFIEQGKKEGGHYWQSSCPLPGQGYFHAPCLFTDQGSNSVINRHEVFGPVLSVDTFRNPQEAVDKANDTIYGLAAGIWSEKGSKVHWVAQKLNAGVIWANTYNQFDATSPFGGFKESGFGREGGKYGLLAYLDKA